MYLLINPNISTAMTFETSSVSRITILSFSCVLVLISCNQLNYTLGEQGRHVRD